MRTYLLSLLFIVFLCMPLPAASDPNSGLTAWALMGANPEFGRTQELRVGYEGLLPGIELAVGGVHADLAEQPAVEEWSVRAYAIANALDAEMIAKMLGSSITLPAGNLYGGVFAQYSFDRADEWSGGYVVGGLVEWPRGWQTVVEYAETLWNNDRDGYSVVFGLRRRF